MSKIEANPNLEIVSGVWNKPDITAISVTIAIGAIALIVGTLGLLAIQGVDVGPFNTLGSVFPKASSALVASVGGMLILVGIGSVLLKRNKDKFFQKEFANFAADQQGIGKQEYYVILDEENPSSTAPPVYSVKYVIVTKKKVFVFGCCEAYAAKVRELEKTGFLNREEISPVAPASKMPLSEDALQGHPGRYLVGMTVTFLAIPAFIIPFFYPFPYAWTLQTVALGVLAATTYGIINDQFALRQSRHYFTHGHTRIHRRHLKTDNPTANAITWGISATWILGLVAGVVLALVATVTHTCAINPLYLTPISIAGSLGVVAYADVKSRQREKALRDALLQRRVQAYFNEREINSLNGNFDHVYLRNVPAGERAGWLGVGYRNGIGYAAMPGMGTVLLVAITAARILLVAL